MFDPAKTIVIANPMARHGFVGENWPALSARIRDALGKEPVVHAYADPVYNRSSFHLAGHAKPGASVACHLARDAISRLRDLAASTNEEIQ